MGGSNGKTIGAASTALVTSPTPCRPVVLCGPSGTGKSTLIARLMKEYPSDFAFSVSHTTRPPRGAEKNGVDYHFTDVPTMQADIEQGKFIEHANVYGKYYGTSKQAVADVAKDHKICVLDIDVQGARSVRAANMDGKFLFVGPPSMEQLEARLRGRNTDKEDAIKNRLAAAATEIAASKEPGLFDKILVNDDFEKCYGEFSRILDTEVQRCRQANA
eukprot:TRINITY_DN3382_c0_g1_i3.p1 TRINITY_DN3382_c0_g1~~TRINITY_DN3382_c0_g1_i3.p1  ORF type:complete len:238 (-),score=46.57 TRINITY_DN3382_c0_g1_i3:142-792(-)